MFNSRRLTGYVLLLLLPLFMVVHTAQAQHLPGFTERVFGLNKKQVFNNIIQKVQTGMPELPEGFEMPEFQEGSPFGELFKYFFDKDSETPGFRDAKSLGSGFIISDDGYIMTNYHVVKDADEIIVRLNDRRELRAEIVGTDQRSDIALVKIDATDLPVVSIGTSTDLEVGEWVLAIGSPFGFDYSATAGIVSAKGRSLPSENYVPFIQTDVAINPGNSGGPLFNQEGKVVGVNSQIYSRTGGYMGLSFAIPIEVAMDVTDQLKATGRVSRGWLGVLIQDVTHDLAESFGMKHPRGALVAKVLPDSPAESAGFRPGDVIVSFNGKDIRNSSSLPPIVGSTKVGIYVPVEVVREHKNVTLKVKLGELPDEVTEAAVEKPQPEKTNRLGLGVTDLSSEQMAKLEIDHGVLVNRISGGAATHAGVKNGDIILSINNETVKDAAHFQNLVQGFKAGKTVAALVQRNGSPTFLAIRVPDDD